MSAVSTKGADVEFSEDVLEAVSRVKQDDDALTWMVAGYKDSNPKGFSYSCSSFMSLQNDLC